MIKEGDVVEATLKGGRDNELMAIIKNGGHIHEITSIS